MGFVDRHHHPWSRGRAAGLELHARRRAILKAFRSAESYTRSAYTPVLIRASWALMVVVHTPALVRSWQTWIEGDATMGGIGGSLGLSLAVLFFVLKLGGVSFLQLRPDRRTALAVCLVTALIHIGCVQSLVGDDFAPQWTGLLGTTMLLGLCTQRRLCTTCRRAQRRGRDRQAQLALRLRRAYWLEGFRPHCWVLASHLFSLRAPPNVCTS